MTSFGHSLVGASVYVLYMPVMVKLHWRVIIFVATIAVANLPDWPISGWGHYRLVVSHSIIVNGVAILCLVVGWHLKSAPSKQTHRSVIIGLTVAWLSHFLLDALYADSRIVIFWPLSEAAVSLPVPWLKTLPHVPPPFNEQIIRILTLEAMTFLPLLVLAATIRWWRTSARVPADRQC